MSPTLDHQFHTVNHSDMEYLFEIVTPMESTNQTLQAVVEKTSTFFLNVKKFKDWTEHKGSGFRIYPNFQKAHGSLGINF